MHFQAPFGGLGATYTVHLRLIGNLVMDFLFMLTELFCYLEGVMAEVLQANIDWKSFLKGLVSFGQTFTW